MSHVVSAGYGYAFGIRQAFSSAGDHARKRLLSYHEVLPELEAMLEDTRHTLDGRWEMTAEAIGADPYCRPMGRHLRSGAIAGARRRARPAASPANREILGTLGLDHETTGSLNRGFGLTHNGSTPACASRHHRSRMASRRSGLGAGQRGHTASRTDLISTVAAQHRAESASTRMHGPAPTIHVDSASWSDSRSFHVAWRVRLGRACSVARTSRVLVFRGGSVTAVDELTPYPDATFLQVVGPGNAVGFSRSIAVASRRTSEAMGSRPSSLV